MVYAPKYMQSDTFTNIIFSYKGTLSFKIFKIIIQLVEVKLERIEPDFRLRRKVFRVFIEILQNIYHHFEEQGLQKEMGSIHFSLRKEKSHYIIVSGNPISKRKEMELRERIDYVNNLTSHEIKITYREKLSNRIFSAKGGAGLGLLDMLRKTGNKVDYKFQAFNNDYSFFNLKVKVSA